MILAPKDPDEPGALVTMIDSAVVLAGFFSFGDWAISLYSLIVIYIPAVLWSRIAGDQLRKTLFIISEKHQLIAQDHKRTWAGGGTYIKAEGIYGKRPDDHHTNVNRRELAILQEVHPSTDPDAFKTVINANEVSGRDPFPERKVGED